MCCYEPYTNFSRFFKQQKTFYWHLNIEKPKKPKKLQIELDFLESCIKFPNHKYKKKNSYEFLTQNNFQIF